MFCYVFHNLQMSIRWCDIKWRDSTKILRIFIFATLYVCDALKKMSWFFSFSFTADNYRPYITSFQGNNCTDYINAVFVDVSRYIHTYLFFVVIRHTFEITYYIKRNAYLPIWLVFLFWGDWGFCLKIGLFTWNLIGYRCLREYKQPFDQARSVASN